VKYGLVRRGSQRAGALERLKGIRQKTVAINETGATAKTVPMTNSNASSTCSQSTCNHGTAKPHVDEEMWPHP
jgi:hypothetical protein